jgi:hypothetical protein
MDGELLCHHVSKMNVLGSSKCQATPKFFNYKGKIIMRSFHYGVVLGVMSLSCVACASAATRAPGDSPLISIKTPVWNETVADSEVTATVKLRADADVSTFRAQLNGRDVSADFEQTSDCRNGLCDRKAYLRGKGFLHGMNALSVEVASSAGAEGDSRVQFDYEAPYIQSEPASKLTPSVAVSSVRFRSGGSPTDYKSYDIVVGPGPDFPEQVYLGSDLTCGAGINSVQVLVLQRKTLSPAATNARQCFSDAASLAAFLKTVPARDLVILNNFLGRMPNIDTRAIGGTNYAGSNINTNYYNAIGVAGATPGTAYESYQPDASHTPRLGLAHLTPLNGSLMLDTAMNYYFAPKDYPEIKVDTNAQDGCTTVYLNAHPNRQCVPANSLGAIFIIPVDRRLGQETDHYYLDTNSNDPVVRARAIGDLNYLLRVYYKPNDLLIISTVGVPFRSSSEVTLDLWQAISVLGGNGFALPKLTTPGSAYTLVTSNDPEFVTGKYSRESTTTRPGETGKLDLVLGRDKKNQYVLYQDYPGGLLTAFNGNVWPTTLFQTPTNWPAWTTGQAAAYTDLTSSNHYPALKDQLACQATVCPDVRQYYARNMSACIGPAALGPTIRNLVFQPDYGYTLDDFNEVKAQLSKEVGYVDAVATLCGFVREVVAGSQTTMKDQLTAVGNNIDSSLRQKALNAQIQVDQLARYANLASIGSLLPYVGSAFSATSTLLNASTLLVSTDTMIPGNFTYTLAQLQDKTNTLFNTRLSLLTTSLFTAVVNDYGKLSKIGGAIGEERTPWYFCSNCDNAPPPITALPTIALGAKRDYYQTLLPTAYDIDLFTEYPDPSPIRYQRSVVIFGGRTCVYPYGAFPEKSFWTYPAFSKPSAYDVYVLNEKGRNGNHAVPPSATLMSDLLDAPVIDQGSFTLNGGAGVNYDDLTRAGSGILQRPAYAPGITCTR